MDFYLLNILLSFVSVGLYVSFRIGVNPYLRLNKISKNFIKKKTKGFRNYWFYSSLKQELGYIYYLNFILISGTVTYLLLAVTLGWSKVLHFPIATLNALLCTVQIPALIFSDINCNKDEYGTPFIIWRKSRSGRWYSSIQDIIVILALIAFAVYNFWLAVN